MSRQHDKPQRSCLACREIHDKNDLIRFVLSPDGEVVPDLDAKLPGRGSYTCNKSACLSAAVKQRGFNRAYKQELSSISAEQLCGLVQRLMRDRILGYLGLANKAGKIISGGSLVADSVRSASKPGLVLVATDVSEAIGEKIENLAKYNHVPVFRMLSKDDFGAILGKAPRSAIAVRSGGFVPRLVNEIKRYRNFLGEVHDL